MTAIKYRRGGRRLHSIKQEDDEEMRMEEGEGGEGGRVYEADISTHSSAIKCDAFIVWKRKRGNQGEVEGRGHPYRVGVTFCMLL